MEFPGSLISKILSDFRSDSDLGPKFKFLRMVKRFKLDPEIDNLVKFSKSENQETLFLVRTLLMKFEFWSLN